MQTKIKSIKNTSTKYKQYNEEQLELITKSFKSTTPFKISREEAKFNGLVHYFTGKKCLRGHIGLRTVGNKNCVECQKLLRKLNITKEKYQHVNNTQYILDRVNRLSKTKKPNSIIDMGNYIIILVTNKDKQFEVLVDRRDYYKTLQFYKWRIYNSGYVFTGSNNIHVNIHQMIMSSTIIDHKNGNKLDNRRSNLIKSTPFLNTLNTTHINNKTGYKGVMVSGKSHAAKIGYSYKRYHLGSYKKPIQGAMAYDLAAEKIFGEHAHLNRNLNAAKYWEDFAKLTSEEIQTVYINSAKLDIYKEQKYA